MPSHHLSKITIDDLDILGYSVAGEESVIAMPQLDVCFDIGKAPDQVIPINNVLLSHGHMDHAAGVGYYLSHRNFCGQSAGTVYAPFNTIEPMERIVDAWGELDGTKVPAKLVGVQPGDEFKIKPNLFVRVFKAKHNYGAVGFSVIEKRKKLKQEYVGLMGPKIVELKKQGIEIENAIEIPIVSYLGDTGYFDYSEIDYISNSKILIAECTFFLDDHKERACEGKHMHIDEFAPMLERMNNEHVIITHLTQRMGVGQAISILRKRLSEECYAKVTMLMDRKWREI
jgi:ribonuclease Z